MYNHLPMPIKTVLTLLLLGGLFLLSGGSRPADIPFLKHTLDLGANESAAVMDVNGDGRLDIVSGEIWMEQPKTPGGKWIRHHFRDLNYENGYIDNFSDLPLDVNGDGKMDIVGCAWFGKKLAWWENPGKTDAPWKEHLIDNASNNEFCFLVDMDNDGKARELITQYGNTKVPAAWWEVKNGEFVKHEISDKSYGHGIGVGDVNGDGRNDVLTSQGWLEAPADPRQGNWKMHPDWKIEKHLGFLHVADLNGDGLNDVISTNAHDYGLFWLEHQKDGTFKQNKIDDVWSQAHAMTMVDLNGDGQMDFVTGKRLWAHETEPGAREPVGVFWYEYRKSADGKKLDWTRHIIDYGGRTGGGMQIPVVDIDGDGDLDIICPGKGGLFWFENLTKKK